MFLSRVLADRMNTSFTRTIKGAHRGFGRALCGADASDWFLQTTFAVFQPVERIIKALRGELYAISTASAGDKKRPVDLCHGVVA